jgi:NHL repeat
MVYEISNGQVSSVAGGGQESFPGASCNIPSNGTNASLGFGVIGGIAVDSAGNLYLASTGDNCVLKVSNHVVSLVAGFGQYYGPLGDGGPAGHGSLSFPAAVAVDSAGKLYIADTGVSRIREVSNGVINTVAGGGTLGENGPAINAQLNNPTALAFNPAGSLFFADAANFRVGDLANAAISNAAGNGNIGYSPDGLTAASAPLYNPAAVALDPAGDIYISEGGAVYKVSNGLIAEMTGVPFSAGNFIVGGVAVDQAGDVYFSGGDIFELVAGTNTPITLDIEAMFPRGLAFDAAGNLYIADTGNNRVTQFSNGVLKTIAGTGGKVPGFGGDGGPAADALLSSPSAVAVDAAGNVYIADTGNNRIRKVTNGVITTIAGSGSPGFAGDKGPALRAEMNSPQGIAVDSAGDVYISDSNNNRIRELVPSDRDERSPHRPGDFHQ